MMKFILKCKKISALEEDVGSQQSMRILFFYFYGRPQVTSYEGKIVRNVCSVLWLILHLLLIEVATLNVF